MDRRFWIALLTCSAIALPATSVASQATASQHQGGAVVQLATADSNQLYFSRALEDLGFARWYLTHAGDERAPSAVRETNQAISLVESMMRMAHLNPKEPAPHDIVSTSGDSLYTAIKFLSKAAQEINATNLPSTSRTNALASISSAIKYSEAGIKSSNNVDRAQCQSLEKAVGDLTASRDDLNRAVSTFGSNHNTTYQDLVRIRSNTNSILEDLQNSMHRACSGS